ncbi:MAG: hypothetical protein ABGX24_04435 [Aquificota bacterium]|jgi:hypothetical protein
MNRLEELFELYKLMKEPFEELAIEDFLLETNLEKQEKINLPKDKIEENLSREFEMAEKPQEGDVIEIVPSIDGLPLLFVVWDINPEVGEVRLVPLSEFYQFATPDDVLVKILPPNEELKDLDPYKKTYIAQPKLFIWFPLSWFSQILPDRVVLKVGKIPLGKIQEIWEVYKGWRKGAGKIRGGIKKAFKKEEARRYGTLQAMVLKEMEETQKINTMLASIKAQMPAAQASSQETTAGWNERLMWKYDPKKGLLILKPHPEVVGRVGKIFLEWEDKVIELWNGLLLPKITIPINPENFLGDLFSQSLRLELLE